MSLAAFYCIIFMNKINCCKDKFLIYIKVLDNFFYHSNQVQNSCSGASLMNMLKGCLS